jgi:hypothetical protein
LAAATIEAGLRLRALGITAAKPYHELRKAHAQSFAQRFGIAEAGLRLGHKPQGVTAGNYLEKIPVSRIVARMA